ncbi:MAG: helix-turn-helix transcriptional regulator [Alistipes sp.]|nr:helix-turn-helix transcriptional regulator [Alistipes sp.]
MDELKLDNERIATKIRQRANALNISISRLCEEAGVSEGFFHKLRKREPSTFAALNKIFRKLEELESDNNTVKE